MRTLLLVALLLVPITVWAQQSQRVGAAQERAVSRQAVGRKTPAQILEENRSSIAVIVAAGNTSLKLGTGFFVRSAGLLLTNFHVVEGTELVGVRLSASGSILWAKKAKGYDLDNDLVALQVETSPVPTVALGDSDQIRVGEPIVVVSNPEGLERTVSNGLISGIRELDGRKLFQISAPTSEGSSGGPVFNERGEVIAVVVASLELGQNLNFAIPINYAKPLLDSPRENLISSLPKRNRVEDKAQRWQHATAVPADPAKMAVEAISRIADEIRACGEEGFISHTKEKKPKYYRVHWGPPTDVRFDVRASDSLVAPYQGLVEFSIPVGMTEYLRTYEEAKTAPDFPWKFIFLTSPVRHQHVFRVDDSGKVRLDYRNIWDRLSGKWVLEQGTANACWERIGYH